MMTEKDKRACMRGSKANEKAAREEERICELGEELGYKVDQVEDGSDIWEVKETEEEILHQWRSGVVVSEDSWTVVKKGERAEVLRWLEKTSREVEGCAMG